MWVELTGVKAYVSNGKVYAYDLLSGESLRDHLPEKHLPQKRGKHWYGNEQLVLCLARLRTSTAKPGSVRELVQLYKENDVSVEGRKAFGSLSKRTRADYAQDLGRLESSRIDGVEVSNMDVEAVGVDIVRALRDGWAKKRGATQAKRIMAACSVLWSYAQEYGKATSNPWRAVKPPAKDKTTERINRPWAAREVWIMLRTAPHLGLARAYCLSLMGLRPEQIPILTLREFRGRTHAKKTKREHHISVPEVLRPYFSDTLSSVMVSNAPDGTPWRTYGQLAAAFRRHRDTLLKDKLIEPGLTLKGLNHTLGAALVEEDASEQEMEATMARSKTMVRHYSDRADKISLAESGFGLLSDWLSQSKDTDEMSKGSDAT